MALGLNGWQRFRLIVFPQAFRTILPPLGNDFVAMVKDSSLVSVLGVSGELALLAGDVMQPAPPGSAAARSRRTAKGAEPAERPAAQAEPVAQAEAVSAIAKV